MISLRNSESTLRRLIIAALVVLAGVSCAHKPSKAPAPQARKEARFDCVAEVVEVKHEAWQVRSGTYSTNDTVWQGVLVISLRLISPAKRAGEVYTLGVVEEREIVIGGKSLKQGNAIRFTATESVLERWLVPEVFSNLDDVARAVVEADGALPKPSSGGPSASK